MFCAIWMRKPRFQRFGVFAANCRTPLLQEFGIGVVLSRGMVALLDPTRLAKGWRDFQRARKNKPKLRSRDTRLIGAVAGLVTALRSSSESRKATGAFAPERRPCRPKCCGRCERDSHDGDKTGDALDR
jgi:hypothetical protein